MILLLKKLTNVISKRIHQNQEKGKFNFTIFDSAESSADAYHSHTPRAYFEVMSYEAVYSVVSVMETHFNQLSYYAYEVMENFLFKMFNKKDTSVEQDSMKTTYADDISTTQLQIESDVLPVIFHNEKPECFDDTITKTKKISYC